MIQIGDRVTVGSRIGAKLAKLRDRVNGQTDSRAEIRKVFATTAKGIQNELAKFRKEGQAK